MWRLSILIIFLNQHLSNHFANSAESELTEIVQKLPLVGELLVGESSPSIFAGIPGLTSLASDLLATNFKDWDKNKKKDRQRLRDLAKSATDKVNGGIPLINLKREDPAKAEIKEVECIETHFMSPFREPVKFSCNSTIQNREKTYCRWNFIGSEPCYPKLNCEHFDLSPGCSKEYFQVYDGHEGVQRFCGKKGPVNISASTGTRDLFITYATWKNKAKKRAAGAPAGDVKVQCTVSCSSKGEGAPLPIAYKPNITPDCLCGQKSPKNRVINGEDGKRGEFPWIAAVVEAQTRQPFCGGSVINDRFILTAAHCLKGKYLDVKNIEIILNGQLLDEMPNVQPPAPKMPPRTYSNEMLATLDAQNRSIRIPLQEIFVHPLYVSETNDFDVALLKLATHLDFKKIGKKVTPVCLPTLGSYDRTFAGKKAWVAGWGLQAADARFTSPKLQKLEVNVFHPKECRNFYSHRVNRRMICGGYAEGNKDSCVGDSGGPLIMEDRPKVWYQIGSVSWGESCALAKNPGVYFRTTESGQWLHYLSNLNDANWCSVPK